MAEQGSRVREAGEGRRPRAMWVRAVSGTLVTLLVVVVGIFALRADGQPVHDVAVTDGSVWVSGGRTGYWGRVNTGSHALDLVISGAGRTTQQASVIRPDILQDGDNVIGVTGVSDGRTEEREVVAIDSRTGQPLEGRAAVPATRVTSGMDFFLPDLVALNGSTLAVVDRASGDLWATRLDPRGGTSIDRFTEEAPLGHPVGPGAAVTVSEDGDVMAVSAANGTVVEIPAEGDGFGSPVRTDLPFEGSVSADITAVGDRWVVLDAAEGMVHAEDLDRPRPLPEGGGGGTALVRAALQQPGPESGVVAVQSVGRADLVEIHDDIAREGEQGIASGLEETGERAEWNTISRPAMNGDCLYAAWGRGSDVLWGATCGAEDGHVSELNVAADVTRASGVAVRQHRGQVLLNDLDTGRVFDLSLTVDPRIDTWPEGAPRLKVGQHEPDTPAGHDQDEDPMREEER